ncbi:MAG: MotA/TolQ/ExbB proton channel family protein [Phycisphaerales bacterium]|nr:MAG: MotA/TolQ/ExbB proton channel family protein [Phycisphaerales bacterium]
MNRMLIAANTDAEGGKTLLEYIQSGGGIGYVIIALSLFAVGLIVAQLVRVRMERMAPRDFVLGLDARLRKGDVRGAIEFCSQPDNESFLSRVFRSALTRCARSPFGFLELKGALEESGQMEVSRLQRSNDTIGVVASIAPMLGLLGTVVGMVGAFDTLSAAEGVAKPDRLAGSISTALMTTVMGLLVAIPCTAAYAYLRGRIDTLASKVAEVTEELAQHLDQNAARKPRPGTPPAQAPQRGEPR